MLEVCIIGTGYVGLVTGACFAELGHRVLCVDVDAAKIAGLKAGRAPIYEPGLDALIAGNVAAGRLAFSTDAAEAVARGARVFFLAVGTPADADGGANLEYVHRAAEDLGRALAERRPAHAARAGDGFIVIVTKSTVPVGTNRALEAVLARHLPPARFAIASNPEFLREGAAIADFMKPDRIVVGAASEPARELLEDLYRPLTRQGVPMIVVSSVETAELVKYAANAFLAMKITFINELARLCEAAGAEIEEVAMGIGADRRIGHDFMKPGPGYGGSCFPKDLAALVKAAAEFDSRLSIAEAVVAANDRHKGLMVEKVKTALGGSLKDKRIAVLGLAFKANTDDMRDAPALVVIPGLQAEGAHVAAYDPIAGRAARPLLPGVEILDSAEAAVRGADAAVIMTEWPEFAALDLDALMAGAARRHIIDLRNVLTPEQVAGFSGVYEGLGRSRLRSGRAAATARAARRPALRIA